MSSTRHESYDNHYSLPSKIKMTTDAPPEMTTVDTGASHFGHAGSGLYLRWAFKEEHSKNSGRGWTRLSLTLAAGITCVIFAMSGNAQVRTQTSTSSGQASRRVKVDRAEVVLVSGNDLVLRMEDGTIRHIANVPETFKAVVDGKEMGIYDLKTGMTLVRTTTITTIPKVVTTMETVKGKVWHVNPPIYVFLTLEDGSNQRFEIPRGQKFNVEGKMVDAWGLKPGMNITATKVVEFTAMEIEQQRKLTGSLPQPPPAPPADVPILVAR
jgi:hypothetical protein